MKKVLCLLLVCILLAGCGSINININDDGKEETGKQTEKVTTPTINKSILVCSKMTESNVNFSTEMAYYFENDKVVKLGVKYVYDLSSYTQDQRNAWATVKMCEMEAMEEQLGMADCQEALDGTNYVVKGYANKLLEQATGSQSYLKSTFESQGWTCVVK